MSWTLSRSVDEFDAVAGALLAAHPAENTVLLTVSKRIAAGQVLLYTDLANPTSNSIYQKLGYAPFGDEVIVELHR